MHLGVRIGIRGKILAVYSLGFSMLLAISAWVQVLAHQAGTEFETRLNHYYAMQSLRVSLEDIRRQGELYLREITPAHRAEVEVALDALPAKAATLRVLEPGPGEIAFRAIGARRGLEAYRTRLLEGLEAAQQGSPNAYQLYLAADRVAGYVDNYLAVLLSASLEDGTRWYRTSSARREAWDQLALGANAAALAAATILVFLLAGSLSRPIRRLAQVSERMAAGDLDVEPVVARTGDEVEVLARSFSRMSQNLREMVGGLQENAQLVRQVHRDELSLVALDRDLKEARFYALQSRIRPHFLFNALNTLARTALLEGARETEELTRRLASLMRYSLGTGHAFVTIEAELGIVREYLSFQGARFGARLTWEVKVDPEAATAFIPRFTLQPLVENAVLHGIEPHVSGGRVVVSAQVRRQEIRLAVFDTGAGMDEATLARVREAMNGQPGADLGVGTASLKTRLAYRYREGVRTALYSRPGRGTLLVIVLPQGGTDRDH